MGWGVLLFLPDLHCAVGECCSWLWWEDGAHGCDQCTFFWGNFWALGDKSKSPVQLIQKDLLMMHGYQWLMFIKFQTQKGYAVSYSV